MKRILYLLGVAAMALACSTTPPASINASNMVDVVSAVCARHDAYVANDQALPAGEAAKELNQSADLLSAVQNAPQGLVFVSVVSDNAKAVSARHDHYVDADPLLIPADQATFKRSTLLLLRVIEKAEANLKPGTY